MKYIYSINDIFKSEKTGTEKLNDLINKSFAKKNPWFGKKEPKNDIDELIDSLLNASKPKKTTTTDTTFILFEEPKHNNIDIIDYIDMITPNKSIIDKTIDELIDEIIGMSTEKKYDFKLNDGTTVKFYDDRIQIGYDVFTLGCPFYASPEKTKKIKKTITDIYISIK